jgi:hypothetical protein
MWKLHYWPTLDYDEPLFTEDLTDEEARDRISAYQAAGWKEGFRYPTSVQFSNCTEVALLTTKDVDWLASPFYREQTTRRIGAEMRVEVKRAARLEVLE